MTGADYSQSDHPNIFIYTVNNIYIYIQEDGVVIWHAAVSLSLIDRFVQVHSLLVSEERARYANLDRRVTKKFPSK